MEPTEISKDKELSTLSGEYADLLSILVDLAFVRDSSRQYACIHEDFDPVLLRALWGASVVVYRRCFNSGRRHGFVNRAHSFVLKAEIDSLNESQRDVHNNALESANQHIAHRVKVEHNQMPIHLLFDKDPAGNPKLAGITSLGALYVGPLPEQSQMLADLAEHLRKKLENLAEKRRAKSLRARLRCSRCSCLMPTPVHCAFSHLLPWSMPPRFPGRFTTAEWRCS
jgi:hypothetical protein